MATFVWREASNYDALSPITQVSGFCFDKNGNVLLLKQTDIPGKQWNIPGGHPEQNETPKQTLQREVYEETTVRIGECGFIGYQEAHEDSGRIAYQLRFAALVQLIDSPATDPAKGVIHERAFVHPNKVMDYIRYPQYLEALETAMRWYKRQTSK